MADIVNVGVIAVLAAFGLVAVGAVVHHAATQPHADSSAAAATGPMGPVQPPVTPGPTAVAHPPAPAPAPGGHGHAGHGHDGHGHDDRDGEDGR